MLILHIIIGLNTGGAEMSLMRLIDAHSESRYYKHHVVSLTSLGNIGLLLRKNGIPVHSLNLTSILNAPYVFFKLLKIIYFTKPSVVHTWMYHANFLGGLATLVTGNRNIIWAIHNSDISVKNGTAISTKYIMKISSFLSYIIPNRIVCVSNTSASAHIKYGYKKSIISIIPNGFDIQKIKSSANIEERIKIRELLNISDDYILVGSVGRYNDYKDYPTFIRAAAIILKLNRKVKFLLIGKNLDQENQSLMDQINNTGHAENFILIGEQSNIPLYLAAMDIFCLHSISEGFPNVLGEAMCMALPCITTNAGDSALMLRNPHLICPVEDPYTLANKILNLISMNETERKKIGKELENIIERNYTIQKIRELYETLYSKVLNT
ncbi:glycosyltransferase [Thiolinea disciformis]|uniref:glycosyltransferase n=1 Tax=Thiolinea disciformis TaxID=125614 RepID=UPI00037D217E|nr:glycosyltransferase [Thiolinea disciformis]